MYSYLFAIVYVNEGCSLVVFQSRHWHSDASLLQEQRVAQLLDLTLMVENLQHEGASIAVTRDQSMCEGPPRPPYHRPGCQ